VPKTDKELMAMYETHLIKYGWDSEEDGWDDSKDEGELAFMEGYRACEKEENTITRLVQENTDMMICLISLRETLEWVASACEYAHGKNDLAQIKAKIKAALKEEQ